MHMTNMLPYPRYVRPRLVEALEDAPVVFVTGVRQCGKTTLVRDVGDEFGYTYISFDDEVQRRAATTDPSGFARNLPERVVLDEVQRVPQLHLSIKDEVDRNRTNGRFILTGSTTNAVTDELRNILTGRMLVIRLHTLAKSEMNGTEPRIIDALFSDQLQVGAYEKLGTKLADMVVAGGYPAADTMGSSRRRYNWYRDYINSQISRELQEFSRANVADNLSRILGVAAAQTAGILNTTNLASQLQFSQPTLTKYVQLLRDVFIIDTLRPWHANAAKRERGRPKMHFTDTGLACAVLSVDPEFVAEQDRVMLGHLFETFLVQEVTKETTWSEMHPIHLFHYRDLRKYEVDLVVDAGRFGIVGVEAKISGTVSSGDFKGLRKLKEYAGDRFRRGVVIYDGEVCAPFGDDMWAIPAGMLWG